MVRCTGSRMPDIDKSSDYGVACKDCIYTRYYPYTLACHAAQKHANYKGHTVELCDVEGNVVEVFTKLTPEIIPDQPPF